MKWTRTYRTVGKNKLRTKDTIYTSNPWRIEQRRYQNRYITYVLFRNNEIIDTFEYLCDAKGYVEQ